MNEFKSDSSVLRVIKNSGFTAVRFVVGTLSGFFLIPFLIKHYGTSSYGLIALAGFLTQYVGMISGCVGGAVGRYINVALNKNDWQQANEIFSTALVANIGLAVIQLPLFAIGVWQLDFLINFPAEIAGDFRILVVCNILIFFISTLSGVLYTPLMAANRLDIGAKIEVASMVLRFALLVGLVLVFGGKLWIIGAVDLGLSILKAIFGYVVIIGRLAQQLRFSWNDITLKWIRPVLDMAGWSLVSMLGFSLFVQTDIWMINRFVSKEMAGIYAALLLWPNLVKQIGRTFGGLIAPLFTIDFARGNLDRMRKTCLLSSQILSYIGAYGCGVFVVAARGLIGVWLGDSYTEYALWAQLMVGQLVFTISGSIVWYIFVAIGKTKYMGIGNLIPGVLNILLSLLLIYLGCGALGVLLGTLVSVFLKENVLFPIWISRETGIPYRSFLLIYLRAGLVFVVVLASGWLVMPSSVLFSFITLIIMALVTFGLALLSIYCMTNRRDRQSTYLFVKTKLLKRSITP